MTDSLILARARTLLGLAGSLSLEPVSEESIRVAAGIRPRAAYRGTDAQNVHRIVVVRTLKGIARIYAIAHEAVHALQAETLGGARAFQRAYWAEDDLARMHGATERDAYRRNRYERDAEERGAQIVAIIAREIEENA